MKHIIGVAKIYCIEVIRDRFFIAILFIGFFLVLLSLVLGGMTFSEQNRILTHLGLSVIHLVTVAIAIFLGAFSISREIERRTYVVTLARPVTRTQFLLGKFSGLSLISLLVVGIFSVLLLLLLGNWDLSMNMFRIALSIWVEALVLVALALLWGVIMKPFLAVTCSIGIYLIGHWQENLLFFAKKSGSAGYENFALVVSYITPDFESANYRAYSFLADGVPLAAWSLGVFHLVAWACGIVVLASLVFGRRDLV